MPIKPKSARSQSRERTNILLAFIDFKLQYYITPTICRTIWLIVLLLAFLAIADQIVSLGQAPTPKRPTGVKSVVDPQAMKTLSTILGWSLKVGIVILFMLVWRVVLECIMVFFNMAQSLRLIAANTTETKTT